jgi:hypothetical protein
MNILLIRKTPSPKRLMSYLINNQKFIIRLSLLQVAQIYGKIFNQKSCWNCKIMFSVATPLWPSVRVKPNTPKVGDLDSSETPKCLEFDSKAQNTSHRGVLDVIGKVLKRRYRKWPRIGRLDIYSPSYGQKKGRKSNWQFDSRPLKVKNRPTPDVRWGSTTRPWKDLDEGYKIGLDLVSVRGCGEELWWSKVLGVQPGHIRDNFGTPFRESRTNVTFGCHSRGRTQSIL